MTFSLPHSQLKSHLACLYRSWFSARRTAVRRPNFCPVMLNAFMLCIIALNAPYGKRRLAESALFQSEFA